MLFRQGFRLSAAGLVAALATSLLSAVVITATPAYADLTTVSVDQLRTGWDRNEPGLAPAGVSASDFGQLFSAQLDGQILAQPVVARNTVLAVTENNKAYGLNPVTGAIRWSRNLGPAWPAAAIGCGDLVPTVGATATPVVDPATGTAYFTAKVNDTGNANAPHWYLHAVDIATGVERTGFPTTYAGAAVNDPGKIFKPFTQMQRPGLLLLGGVVYAAFGGHCDYQGYVGWVIGVNGTSGAITSRWVAETGSGFRAGIWQSGGGLVSDGPGQILLTTGNGVSAKAGPGKPPPGALGEAVVRLAVGTNGQLAATDYFSPVNATQLDQNDTDLGAGGPMGLPTGFGTTAHPHLMVQVGKDGRVFLIDRDDLGGSGQGPGGSDKVLQAAGPFNGVWGHPALWGGDGGYVYTIENAGPLRAFAIGRSGSGLPSLTSVGTSPGNWGYTSGSPVVTSSGTTSGSALVWAIYSTGPTGAGGQLRAYDAVPASGVMHLRYSVPIGTASKFSVPATDAGRVYVGTKTGALLGFGRPTTVALSGTPTDFGSVPVGGAATRSVTVTATRAVTITAVDTAAPFTRGAVTLPVTLAAGATLTVPVTFKPTVAGPASGGLNFSTGAGPLAFDLHGTGTRAGLDATPQTLAFGDVPTGGNVTLSARNSNTGTTTTTITGVTAPLAPFSSSSLPQVGATLAPGASVSVPVTFTPGSAGAKTGSLVVRSSTGAVTVPLTGRAVVGAPHLTLTPAALDFGTLTVGGTATRTFEITNTGNLVLTITKAAPPAGQFGAPTPVAEGQQLDPGETLTQSITFTPTLAGAGTGSYLITGNDGQGAQTVSFTGRAVAPTSHSTAIPGPAAGGWSRNGSAVQAGADSVLTPVATGRAGSIVQPTPVSPEGLHVTFTAQIDGGGGADGLTFAMLDAAKATSTSVGRSGASLGFGSLPGVAVALDTYQSGNDPSGNFVGIATGATGPNFNVLTWAATAVARTELTAGTHAVDVSVANSVVTVRLDGGAPLSARVVLPQKVLLAFTAATGGLADRHIVRNVVIISSPAPAGSPAGRIVGAAGKCMDVNGAVQTNGTAVQLYPCNGSLAQKWTLAADHSIRALGSCLDVVGGAPAAGTPMDLFTCSGGTAQVWLPQPNRTLFNPGSGMCLTVPAGSNAADRTRLVISACAAAAGQLWALP